MKSVKGYSFSPFRSVFALLFLLSTCSSVFTPLTSAATPAHFQHGAPTEGRPTEIPKAYKLSRQDEVFIEDLQRRSFQYFWEQADPHTGLVPDRARMDRAPLDESHQNVASIAATGFGLTALCIAAEREWITSQQARERTRNTLRFFADKAFQQHGWFYHWLDAKTGERRWNSEVSSIDTALLLAGVLTARQYFHDDREIVALANKIYDRVDFKWMLNGRSVSAFARLETRDRFLKTPLGYIQRRHDSLSAGNWINDTPDPARILVRLLARPLSIRRS